MADGDQSKNKKPYRPPELKEQESGPKLTVPEDVPGSESQPPGGNEKPGPQRQGKQQLKSLLEGEHNQEERDKPRATANTNSEFDSPLKDPGASENEWIPALLDWSKQQNEFRKNKRQSRKSSFLVLTLGIVVVAVACLCNQQFAMNQRSLNGTASNTARVDYHPYILNMQNRIKSHWHPGSDLGQVVAHFKIHQNGNISDLGLSEMTHNSAYDLSTLKAIEDAAPFEKLPDGAAESVDVTYTFVSRNGVTAPVPITRTQLSPQ